MLATTLLCLVVGISDGGTISARCPTQDAAHPYQQIKVRFQGIDAPERKQPFGNRAREALSELVYMKEAELRCSKIDRYKRHICSCVADPATSLHSYHLTTVTVICCMHQSEQLITIRRIAWLSGVPLTQP